MKIFKIIFFMLLACFVGFGAGMFVGAYTSREIIGLDANLNTLKYGMGGGFIGLLTGLFLSFTLNAKWFNRIFLWMSILSIVLSAFIAYRLIFKLPGQTSNHFHHPAPGKIVLANNFQFTSNNDQQKLPIGTGLAKPQMIPGKPLYFYSHNAFFSMPEHLTPGDSITFKKGPYYIDIATAPPWLVPEILKLDYNAFYLRTLTVSKNWLEVVVNSSTGQTSWISRNSAEFIDWHDFLLNVVAIELIDTEKNPLRLKPLEHAGILATAPARFQLKPLAVMGDWIMVATNGLADRIPPVGWVRWRDENQMLISYSILE